jgi:hypothetical protein
VTVDVRNSGNGNTTAIATVIVYWADPTVGFTHPNYFAATAIAVPTDRTSASSVTTPTMTATIPATAPDHICLVVAVTHPQDLAGTVCDPINDRHWAQRNLQAVPAANGDPITVRFNAANPFAEGRVLVLQIRAADKLHAARVARELGTEPVAPQTRLQLLDSDGRRLGDTADTVRTELELRAHEVRTFALLVEPEQQVPAGRSSVLEAELVDPRKKGAGVGSLGFALVNGNKA